MESKFQTIKAEPDSQYRLIPCRKCKSDDVVYIRFTSGGMQTYRVRCRSCGQRTPWRMCRHDAQRDWNEMPGGVV